MKFYKKIIILLLVILLILTTICKMYLSGTLYKEGFEWSSKDFLLFEKYRQLSLPYTQFDLEMLQKQASPDEMRSWTETGYWPWKEETKNIFLEELGKNTLIKSDPKISLDYYQKRYNENAIHQLLRWNTNEGQFILRGVTIPDGTKYQCKENLDGSSSMYKVKNKGYNFWNGYGYWEKEKVEDKDLPNEIPGFSYINEPCNPCENLDPEKSCPFHLQLENDKEISPIWKMNWGIVGF